MKKLWAVLLLLVASGQVFADEGMWVLKELNKQNLERMKELGFTPSYEQLYSETDPCVANAVVIFGGGCSGITVSNEGLVFTNHHCGFGSIQQLSSVEHDYLKDGFVSQSKEEELPVPGLTVRYLRETVDVSDRINSQIASIKEEHLRLAAADSIGQAMADSVGNTEFLAADVVPFYNNNKYFLIVYDVFNDVRMVFAPPSSVGKFGGDTDNWMWPRHTGDFSIFRIYADKDNNPAPYSEDNVPYRPKRYFKISLSGVGEGDFTFVYGFPGRTQEYIMSEGVRYVSEVSDPHKIALRTKRLDIQRKYMESDRAVRIQYASKNAGVANAWKKWQGEMKGINRLGTVQAKRAYEKRFSGWAESAGYGDVLGKLDSLYKAAEPYSFIQDYYMETAYTVELARFARSVMSLNSKGASEEEFDADADAFYKDYYMPIDKECFVAVMDAFDRNVPEDFQPAYFRNMMSEYGSAAVWADALFAESMFTDKCNRMRFTDSSAVADDPAVVFSMEFSRWYSRDIYPELSRIGREITLLNREYMKGQMEFEPEKAFYPDANLTLRVAYGQVAGYSPSDGIYYEPYSTIDGIMEKDNPEIYDYNIPQKLRELYASEDFGKWTEDGRVPVCFIATNHTSGGNSGSPVINADGNLVGINFDRVWEGTMSDIAFDPAYCRNISLDIRYVLFIIDRLAGAAHLIEEMEFAD